MIRLNPRQKTGCRERCNTPLRLSPSKAAYLFFVVSFWMVMMGMVIKKEVMPAVTISTPSGYRIEVSEDIPVRESWMGVYFRGEKMGFTNSVIREEIEEGRPGYRANETALLRLPVQGEKVYLRIKGNSFYDENYILRSFDYSLISSYYKLNVKGEYRDGNLNILFKTGEKEMQKSIPLKKASLIFSPASPILLFKKLNLRKEMNLRVFNPVTTSLNNVLIKDAGTEDMKFAGTLYKTRVLDIEVEGLKARTWMTEDGDILKEESPLGFEMRKETPEEAVEMGRWASSGAVDLASQFRIVPQKGIIAPRDVNYLKVDKNGSIVEIYRDAPPVGDEAAALPVESDIPEEPFIQSRDPRIVRLAREITKGASSSWDAAKRIMRWVYLNVKKVPTLSVPSSVDVLEIRQGDCNEHTVLFTALARAVGIPTRMIAGLVYTDGAFYYHAWPEVFVGRWIDMDPTLGEETADATHIPLVEGGLDKQIGLIKEIGDIKIKVLEYR